MLYPDLFRGDEGEKPLFRGLRERAEAGALLQSVVNTVAKRGIAVKRERARPNPIPSVLKSGRRMQPDFNFITTPHSHPLQADIFL